MLTSKTEILHPYFSDDEAGIWASICVEGGREVIQFALAAGIAHALVKLNNSILIDEVGIWTKKRESTVFDFQNQLRLKTVAEDFLEAIKRFYLTLPGTSRNLK
jgi:hypothetical protein